MRGPISGDTTLVGNSSDAPLYGCGPELLWLPPARSLLQAKRRDTMDTTTVENQRSDKARNTKRNRKTKVRNIYAFDKGNIRMFLR
jgi:hypothetical protein